MNKFTFGIHIKDVTGNTCPQKHIVCGGKSSSKTTLFWGKKTIQSRKTFRVYGIEMQGVFKTAAIRKVDAWALFISMEQNQAEQMEPHLQGVCI